MQSLILFMLLVPVFSWGSTHSAYRHENKDCSHYEKKYLLNIATSKNLIATPLSIASNRSISDVDITKWKSLSVMLDRFRELRDMRFIQSSMNSNFIRRISWLYPDDGCFARAALFNRNTFRKFVPIPNKIFAFGNLKVTTRFSPKGYVTWWYHVAPIVEVDGEKYVLDPSIELEGPLKLEEWLKRMGDPKKIRTAICSSGTYSPGDNCNNGTDGLELLGLKSQSYYLNLEWKRMQQLGLDPSSVLGDSPPWE